MRNMSKKRINGKAKVTRRDYVKMIGKKKKLKVPGYAKHLHLLNLMGSKNINTRQRKALINTMNKSQMQATKGMVNDFLNQRYPVPPKIIKRLKRDKQFIYDLVDRKTLFERQKKILRQRGGFLGILAGLAATILPSLLNPIIKAITK